MYVRCLCKVAAELPYSFFTSRKLLYQHIMLRFCTHKFPESIPLSETIKLRIKGLSCEKELVSEVKCRTRGDWYSLTLSQALVRFDCGMFLCGLLRKILSAISAIPFVGYIWVIFSIEYQVSAYSVFSSRLNGTFIPRCDKVSPQS